MKKLYEGFYKHENGSDDFIFSFVADPNDDVDSAFKRALQEEYDEDVEPAQNEYDIIAITFVKDYKTDQLYQVNLVPVKN